MNPQFLLMLEDALIRGFEAWSSPMPCSRCSGPRSKPRCCSTQPAIRPTADDPRQSRPYTQALHEVERGRARWVKTIAGFDWLDGTGSGWRSPDAPAGTRARRTPGRATRASSPNTAGASMRQVPPSSCCCRRCDPNMTSGNHQPLLGHSQQEPGRHDVCVEPHGREAQGIGTDHRRSVYA